MADKPKITSAFNNRPYKESDFRAIYQQKAFSRDPNKPIAGAKVRIKHPDRPFDAEIIAYFDDERGEEHVLIKNGPISMIRRVTDIV